jgi:hypothetical protein
MLGLVPIANTYSKAYLDVFNGTSKSTMVSKLCSLFSCPLKTPVLPILEVVKSLVEDAVQAIQNNATSCPELVACSAENSTIPPLIQPTAGNATKFPEYENRNYGIRIQYPSDWSI